MANGHAHCVLTVDVEDWFHILDSPVTPPVERWEQLPSRVESNVERMLTILSQHKVQATFFFLGWIADRFPQLVKKVAREGHEIASHGYAHALVSSLSVEEFLEDVLRTREILDAITGTGTKGYRAPGFSLPADPAYAEALSDAGYEYDSSLFPGHHPHAGSRPGPLGPHDIRMNSGRTLREYPVSMLPVMGRRVCVFGGGYLRLTPYALIRRAAVRVQRSGRPVIFYVHPREIDSRQPRLPLKGMRRFRTYVNLSSTEPKLHRLLSEFDFITMSSLHAAAETGD